MNDFSLDHQFSVSSAAVADATIRIIASRGLDAVSVREVAKESGLAAGSVQYHAPNKEILLAHAFIRSIQRQTARLDEAPIPNDVFEAWVVRLSELLPLGGERHEDAAIWVTYGSASATRDWMADLYSRVLRDFQQAVVAELGDRDNAERKARLITALVNGLTIDNLGADEAEADRVVGDLRQGLRLILGV
ncbi:helix-turn-helix transcriptional regulator [Corynebacterium sp. CCUG 59401]|nr:helix-turn-helix transcriptional regulator [Corynebacterium pseudogenitalium]